MGRKIQKGDTVEVTAIHKVDAFHKFGKEYIGYQIKVDTIKDSNYTKSGRYKTISDQNSSAFFIAVKVKMKKEE